jgi:2-succinyl-6-hydroxy-2,4-cyclohexadiene-1-carboxylate synthase
MLATSCFGDVKNHALIFFHGFLGCKEDWYDVIDLLKNHYFCLCIDLPGHGQSPYSVSLDNEILSIFSSFSLIKPSAVGYSMGGRILKQLQKQHPRLFHSLYFLSSHPGIDSEEKKLKRSHEELNWIKKIETFPIDVWINEWYNQSIFDSLRQKTDLFLRLKSQRLQQNKDGLLFSYKQYLLSQQPQYTNFDCPATFFFGEYDKKYEELYLKKNWNVRIEKISQSGHCIHIENPDECAQKIHEYMQLETLL